LATALQKVAAQVPKKAAAGWAQLTATIAQLEDKEIREKPSRMIQLILDAGYDDYLKDEYANYQTRREDLQQLAAFAAPYRSLEDFLAQVALQSGVESEEKSEPKPDEEQIRLSTIHQAKGLEFDAVFVIMLCEGLFPSTRSIKEPAALEEERRLFYVAITRAKDELYLSHPLMRFTAGAADKAQVPSRFLGEIPRDLVEEWNLRQW
jgi:DNA helicase-2/ATP-dependent DNA helicase PcrA